MPEGDTVHKLAAAMRPALEDQVLDEVWLRDRGPVPALAGRRVRDVSALGKHLLVAIEGFVLHVHLGMRGRWHRYSRGEPWSRPESQASLRLDTEKASWVCFRAARAELLRSVDLALHPALSRLGPDLLGESLDVERIVARARAREPRSAADLLLDQRVACGIGNVYKNEVLFLEGVHPETPVSALPDETLRALYRRARRLMGQNLGGWRRTTTRPVDRAHPLRPGEPRFWVYDHAGRPCARCGTRIRGSRTGDAARSSYWCPGCQPAPGG